MKNEIIIDRLVGDLKPVKPMESPLLSFFRWAGVCIVIVSLEIFLTGGTRKNFIRQLKDSPRFSLETFLAALIFLLSGYCAIQMSVPDDSRPAYIKWAGPAVFTAFMAMIVYGLWNPALPPSEENHRYFCEYVSLAFGIIPALLLYLNVKRRAPTEFGWSGALIVLGAIGLPMAFMQISCMYSPEHILIHHIVPLLVYALIGIFLGRKSLAWS